METGQEKTTIREIEQRYTDWITPLMPYCTGLTAEWVRFRFPMHLLSGGVNVEMMGQLFRQIDMQNDVREKLRGIQDRCVEMELGDFKTYTLYFRETLRPEYQLKLTTYLP